MSDLGAINRWTLGTWAVASTTTPQTSLLAGPACSES